MRRPAVAPLLAYFVLSFLAASGLVAARDLDGAIGEKLFRRQWVGAPASTAASDGLGPLYNARSCAGCHGANGNGGTARVIHLQSRDGRPDPIYGFQIQDKALPGFAPEAKVAFAESGAEMRPVVLPQLVLAGPALDPATVMTVRRAPDLAAVGRIAEASDAAILAHADPDDRDGDGISGRPAMVIEDGQPRLGRYGLRATAASLGRQISLAFATDLGMSSLDVRRPAGDCTAVQAACVAAPNGRDGRGEEIAPAIVDALRRFLMQQGAEPRVLQAAPPSLFAKLGCAGCHVPELGSVTGGKVALFSDLLLHDMGAGLSDGTAQGDAGPGEWRTAPLVGIGRPGRRLLHDGRAQTLDQAIRWHGGEALAARQRYEALAAPLRQSLISYLTGL